MHQHILSVVCSGLLFAFRANAKDLFDPRGYASKDVITRDVAVIGGGASGTFGAINLRRLGKSVMMIERDAQLGGHTNTYTDPSTGVSIDYGTQAFWNISVTRDYFSHLNITVKRPVFAPLTTLYADFQTGQQVTVEASTNFTPYTEQLSKYPYLLYSWKLPSPVPEDLFLPFAAFIAKYNLRDVAFSIFSAGQGFANILDQLTVHVMKMVDESYIQSVAGDSIVPQDNNGEIYVKAAAFLGQDVLLSSTVVAARRPSKSGLGIRLVVQTPSGQKLIQASKLLITIPPLLDNMKPFYLDHKESNIFSQWSYSNYFTMLITNTGLPSGFHYANANASTSTFNIPPLPAPYQITATRIPGLFYVWYGSPTTLTPAEVKADVAAVIKRLRPLIAANGNSTVSAAPRFVRFRSHTPFKLVVSRQAIEGGFYERLEGLQGHRRTWYTGAAFISHDAAVIWNYTQAVVLPKLLAG
ncbi:FAD-dependent oxidoreductase dbaF [Physcia stellaris]|nr:FAD-dependent oxidoreductase dbaF [Physcia stellaris]